MSIGTHSFLQFIFSNTYLQHKHQCATHIHSLRRFPKLNKQIYAHTKKDYTLFLAEQLTLFVYHVTHQPISKSLREATANQATTVEQQPFSKTNIHNLRVHIIHQINPTLFSAQIDDDQDQVIHIEFSQLINQYGYTTISFIEPNVVLRLIQPRLNEQGQYCPQHIILEPIIP